MPGSPTPLVAVLAYEGLNLFEFSCAFEIFGRERPELAVPWYRFTICTVDGNAVVGQLEVSVTPDSDLTVLDDASIVLIPGWPIRSRGAPNSLLEALCRAHGNGAKVVSICSGAFLLAETGLLDNRRATTHWLDVPRLQELYPAILVEPDVLYVDEGGLMTSAGSAAGLDLCLHLVRQEYGAQIANSVARQLVIPPHREGGQAQFIERPVQRINQLPFAVVLDAMNRDLQSSRTVKEWAHFASMSERNFIRRFKQTTAMTPKKWQIVVRVDRARELLESTDLPVEAIAQECGFNTAATLRHHFRRIVGLSPRSYRDNNHLTQ